MLLFKWITMSVCKTLRLLYLNSGKEVFHEVIKIPIKYLDLKFGWTGLCRKNVSMHNFKRVVTYISTYDLKLTSKSTGQYFRLKFQTLTYSIRLFEVKTCELRLKLVKSVGCLSKGSLLHVRNTITSVWKLARGSLMSKKYSQCDNWNIQFPIWV